MTQIHPIDEPISYISTSTQQAPVDTDRPDFEQVLQQETIIYADSADDTTFMDAQGTVTDKPAAVINSLPGAVSRGSSSVTPAELEPIFEQAANQYGVSKQLLQAVARAESNFNPSATSSAGAIGIMQLMPDTAKHLGVTDPYDATENIMGGARYLSNLLSQYNGDTSLALAAYNAGSGNVAKYGGVPPFKETQNYVNRILAEVNGTTTSPTAAVPSSDAAVIYAVAAQSATHSI